MKDTYLSTGWLGSVEFPKKGAEELESQLRAPVSRAERQSGRLAEGSVRSAAASFREHGLCVLDGALDPEALERGASAAQALFDRDLAYLADIGEEVGLGAELGFVELMKPAQGGCEPPWSADHAFFADPALSTRAIWHGLVRALLGDEYYSPRHGVLMPRPSANEHAWHRDGEHLFPSDGPTLPVHCLNVIVPLVDLRADNGAAEFCLGSHRLSEAKRTYRQDPDIPRLEGRREGLRGPIVTPQLDRGSVLLFDDRIVHRGRPSRSPAPRPALYLTYALPWFHLPDRTARQLLGIEP